MTANDLRPSPDWPNFWDKWRAGDFHPGVCGYVSEWTGTLVDVGAWIGPVTLSAKKASRRIAVEPDPVALEILEHNCPSDVEIVPGAVSDHDGTVHLSVHKMWGDSQSWVRDDATESTVEVPCARLCDLLDDLDVSGPTLVKIDVEGHEAAIIPDAEPGLHERGCTVILESHSQAATAHLGFPMSHWNRWDIGQYQSLMVPR